MICVRGAGDLAHPAAGCCPNLWVGLIEEAAKGFGVYFMARG